MTVSDKILIELALHFYYEGWKDGKDDFESFMSSDEIKHNLENILFNDDVYNYQQLV